MYEHGKCIPCGACIAVAAEAGDGLGLAIVGRGFEATVAVPLKGTLVDALPSVARRVADICPTGAFGLKGVGTCAPPSDERRMARGGRRGVARRAPRVDLPPGRAAGRDPRSRLVRTARRPRGRPRRAARGGRGRHDADRGSGRPRRSPERRRATGSRSSPSASAPRPWRNGRLRPSSPASARSGSRPASCRWPTSRCAPPSRSGSSGAAPPRAGSSPPSGAPSACASSWRRTARACSCARRANDADRFVLKLAPGTDVNAVQQTIEDQYGQSRHLQVETTEAFRARIRELTNRAFGLLDVLASIGVIVAALGVINTLMMTVLERRREIGALRSIGMTRAQIIRMILAEAGAMGAIGAVFGIGFGILLSRVFVEGMKIMTGYRLEFSLPFQSLLLGLAIALIVSQAAALYPAWKGSRVNIVEAIKHE